MPTSRNCTLPGGTPPALLTVATKVTGWPATPGLGNAEVTVVTVPAGPLPPALADGIVVVERPQLPQLIQQPVAAQAVEELVHQG